VRAKLCAPLVFLTIQQCTQDQDHKARDQHQELKTKGGHRPGRVREFDNGQGKVGKMFSLWCVTAIVMVTE